jgi:predicted transcriptional regulator
MAAESARGRDGQFIRRSGRDPIALCAMAKEIAIAATARHPDPAFEPEDVSERAWNDARVLVPGGETMPLAWETARQIGGGEAIPWKELLATLFRASTPEQALRVLSREEPWPDLSETEISYALLAAEQLLDEGQFLFPGVYREKREELLRRDRRRRGGGNLRLPTVDQILVASGGDWRRACLNAGIVAIPPEVQRSPRIRRKRDHWDSREALLTEMLRYSEWLKSRRSTQRTYHAYRDDHPEAPSLHTVQERGGLDALLAEARTAGRVEQAREADRAAASPEAVAERRQRQLAETAAKPEAKRILGALAERGMLSHSEIQEACGLTRNTTTRHLKALVEVGFVQRTHPTGAKNLRFYVGDLTDTQRSEADSRRTERLLDSKTGQSVWAVFRDGDGATTEEVARTLAMSPTAARTWIRRLLDTGRICRRVVGLPGGGRSYVYVRN